MLELDKAANVEIAKLVHAEELAFHIRNRRNKQLGLWLAKELELDEDSLDYAKTIVALASPSRTTMFWCGVFERACGCGRFGYRRPPSASSSSANQLVRCGNALFCKLRRRSCIRR